MDSEKKELCDVTDVFFYAYCDFLRNLSLHYQYPIKSPQLSHFPIDFYCVYKNGLCDWSQFKSFGKTEIN